MVDFALGTQTAASIIRPASFCGIYGFKPSFGSVSVAGVKSVAPSLDTIGWFARDPATLGTVWSCLTSRPTERMPSRPPRVALIKTDQWGACGPDATRAVVAMASDLRRRQAEVELVELPAELIGLADEHRVIMAYEAARSLAFEHRNHRNRLSHVLCGLLDEGRTTDPTTYDAVRRRITDARLRLATTFTRFDAILTPAATGEAPLGLQSTGDPRCGRIWTMLGLPSVSIPHSTGATGLPVGVQLVGAEGADGQLLSLASWLATTYA